MSGEPLRTTTFMLTSADALAYERVLPRFKFWKLGLFLVWLALGAGAVWFIPVGWRGTQDQPGFWLLGAIFLTINYVLALMLASALALRRARRRIRRPIEVTLEEWPEKLGILGYGIPRYVEFPQIEAHFRTRTHLFIRSGDDVLILPRAAFREEGAFEALAGKLAALPPFVPPREDAPAVDPAPAIS